MSLLSFVRGADRRREEFDAEVLVHFREIYRAAYRLARRAAEAEDLTQEVFLQAWKSFDRYESGTNGRAWLHKILWNVRQQSLRKRVPIPLGAEGEARLAETLPAEETTPTEVRDEDVRAALDALSEDHRQIVLLCDVEGFTYKELADILKTPIGTVMSRLSRARGALKAHLRDAGLAPAAAPGGVSQEVSS